MVKVEENELNAGCGCLQSNMTSQFVFVWIKNIEFLVFVMLSN